MNRLIDRLARFVARDPKAAATALLVTTAGWVISGLAFLVK